MFQFRLRGYNDYFGFFFGSESFLTFLLLFVELGGVGFGVVAETSLIFLFIIAFFIFGGAGRSCLFFGGAFGEGYFLVLLSVVCWILTALEVGRWA